MGQKCTCFNKDGESTFYFDPQNKPNGQSYNNVHFAKASNRTRGDNTTKAITSYLDNSVSEVGTALYDDFKVSIKVIKVQACLRGFIARKKMEKMRSMMITDIGTQISYKDTMLSTRGPFIPSNWRKYWKEETGVAQYEYGHVFGPMLVRYEDGSQYSGQVDINKKKQGMGILISKDGSVYEGSWLNDSFTGYGRCMDSEGNYYEGIDILS